MHQEFLTIGSGSLEPGAGVDETPGSAGDLFITGIVAPTGPLPQLNLQDRTALSCHAFCRMHCKSRHFLLPL